MARRICVGERAISCPALAEPGKGGFLIDRFGFVRPIAARRSAVGKLALAALLALSLGACEEVNPSTSSNSSDSFSASAPVTPVQTAPLPGAPAASQVGTGAVHVAVILPLTQASGAPSIVGTSLQDAVQLAADESGGNAVTLSIKDDHSTPDGAKAAAQQAVAENDDIILGPLFSPNVRAVGEVAQAANKPVIAFSTDTSTGAPGVYLLSFLVENYVDRIVDYAASQGKKSFAALIPNNDYGRVASAEFQQIAAQRGLRVMEIENYTPQTLKAAVGKIAALGSQIDALFIPEQAEAMPTMARALAAAGLNSQKVQILGTGLWNDARVLGLPPLQGAWFAAPENGGFQAFAQRYRAKFGSDPTRIATLGYDAVSLVIALAKRGGADRFSENVLTSSAGFNGADGIFRFKPNGQNERALAIFEIRNSAAVALIPAPRSFAGRGSAT
ncbi:ethanolamine utilization protein EutM [Methylovirgula ligni]|nr:ethanolamine utilization protein EutM [Methylovirgula ligni]